MIHQASVFFEELLLNLIFTQICQGKDIKVLNYLRNHQSEIKATPQEECKCEVANFQSEKNYQTSNQELWKRNFLRQLSVDHSDL